MSEDNSNIIPINRKLIQGLELLIKTINTKNLRSDISFNAIFITCEGFMRQERVQGRVPYFYVPIFQPITTTIHTLEPTMDPSKKMQFQLDLFKSTEEYLIYREIR